MHQDVGRRCTSCETDAGLAFEPFGLKFRGGIHHIALRTTALRHITQAVAVGTGGASYNDDQINFCAQYFDSILSILCRITNVLHFGAANIWKARHHCLCNFCCIVHTQCGLRYNGKAIGLLGLNMHDICNVFHQINTIYQLAHRAFNFRMAFVADHHEFKTLFVQLGNFHMHLGNQRTGGIKHSKTTARGFSLY